MTREEIIKDGFFEETEIDACLYWIKSSKKIYPDKTEKELYEMYKEMMFQNS